VAVRAEASAATAATAATASGGTGGTHWRHSGRDELLRGGCRGQTAPVRAPGVAGHGGVRCRDRAAIHINGAMTRRVARAPVTANTGGGGGGGAGDDRIRTATLAISGNVGERRRWRRASPDDRQ
jgi:hypothetical protein